MADLSFEDFKQKITDEIKNYLPEWYQDSTVQINTVQKNNEALDSITITSPESNVCPTIYLNSFYEEYKDGKDIESIMDKIADIRVNNEISNDFDVSMITDFDQVKDKIAARLVGLEDNAELLSQRPHETMADIAVTYSVMLGENENGLMSVPITNQLMETWGTTKDELYELALTNMDKLEPSTFRTMNEVLADIMIPKIMEDSGVDRETAEQMVSDMMPPEDKMFVLSNEQKLNGASALLDDKMMDQVAEKIGGDFYILPSSVHEVLIVPADAGMELRDFEAMVQEVNETQVAPQDRLSNHVYQYDNETHEIFRADKAEEHYMAKEAAEEVNELPADAIADKPKEKNAPKRENDKVSLKERLEEKKKESKSLDKKELDKAVNKTRKTEQSL